jgi:hypothetical protein
VRGKTAKLKQWNALEESTNAAIPLENSKVTSYRLLATDELDKLAPLITQII